MPLTEYLKSRIAVLETKWFEHKNTSVRGMFDLLSDLKYGHHHGYRYEMFGGKSEFARAFDRLAEKNGVHYIYIAAHGDEDGLQGSMKSDISTRAVGVRIAAADDEEARGKLVGLFFGSCSFGQARNLEALLRKGSKLRWIAGYEKDVDFIDSTALDFMFFHTLLSFREDKLSELGAIKETAKALKFKMPGLIESLGFSLFLWERDHAIKLI